MPLNNGERIIVSEEKILELEKGNRETNKVLQSVSTQVNSLCISQVKITTILDGLTEKIDDLKKSYKEKESKVDSNKEICDSRYNELIKTTTSIAIKQKIMYTIASLISAGIIGVIAKIIIDP